MPFKHQAESYRTINGKRWESWGDFPASEAVTEGYRLKREGWNVRRFKMDDDMVRIFRCRPDTHHISGGSSK